MPEQMTKQDAIEKLEIIINDYTRDGSEICQAIEIAINALKQPTIEPEVRRGRWIEKPPYEDETVKGLEFQIVCSRCDEQNSSITFDENSVAIAKTFYRTRYCPNCGAKMYADGGTISKERLAEIMGGADNG